jgi:hypothetical protein
MNARSRSLAASSALVFALAALAAGCGEEKKTATTDTDAGASGPQKPVLDGKLGAAVKAAETAQPAKGGGDGPPESGVFAAGNADKAHPPNAPAKIEVLGEGNEPRVPLALAPTEDEQKEAVSIVMRQQGGGIPADYTLAVKQDKPKGDKADKDKKAEGPKSARVLGKIAGVTPNPQVPRELADKIGKLKGTELRYTLGPDGGASELGYTLAKDADPALGEAVVKGLVDAIGLSLPPLPSKPLGAGGFWMVTDRSSTFGVEVVRYRVYRVEKIEKDRATLSVDVRQYAAKNEVDLGALGGNQKLGIDRFESTGKGKIEWTASGLLPARAETSVRTGVAGRTGNGQNGVLQAEVSAKLAAGEADKGDKKK